MSEQIKVTVKMISTHIGADDGIQVKKYIKDYVYDLSKSLAKCFVDLGVAKVSTAKVNGKGKIVTEGEVNKKIMKELAEQEAAQEKAAEEKKQEEAKTE